MYKMQEHMVKEQRDTRLPELARAFWLTSPPSL